MSNDVAPHSMAWETQFKRPWLIVLYLYAAYENKTYLNYLFANRILLSWIIVLVAVTDIHHKWTLWNHI